MSRGHRGYFCIGTFGSGGSHGKGDSRSRASTQSRAWSPVAAPSEKSNEHNAPVTRRTRKLIGTLVLILFLPVYVWFAAAIGMGRITLAPAIVQFFFFMVAGLLWVLPAGLLIWWMQRPD